MKKTAPRFSLSLKLNILIVSGILAVMGGLLSSLISSTAGRLTPSITSRRNGRPGLPSSKWTQALNAPDARSPQEILRAVRRRVDEFSDGAEQFDDLTMLCITYKGPPKRAAEPGAKEDGA